MSERVSSLRIPKLIGRLNQLQYIPVYDVNQRKQNGRREAPDWFDYLVHNYKSEKYNDVKSNDKIPPTYVSARRPPPLNKTELGRDIPSPTVEKQAQQKPTESEPKNLGEKNEELLGEAKYQKFSRMMEVDTTSEDNTPNATLHLPQIMKSFLPGASRKAPAKTTTSMHSSWIDLTSRKKIKQVAPNSYKLRPKLESFPRRVTLFTVNYDSNSSRRLKRRPLPPLAEAPQVSNSLSNAPPPVWQPSLSQTPRPHHQGKEEEALEARSVARTTMQVQETKAKALGTLLGKMEKSRHLTLPHDSFKRGSDPNKPSKRWENGATHKVLRSRRRRRRENDHQFGVRGGVVLNKLPSDLIGNVQTNFQNLEYYLGRVNEPRDKNEKVVYIPTGGLEENHLHSHVTNHSHPPSEFRNGSDVRMRYAHRGSDDTPPLESFSWKEKLETKTPFSDPQNTSIVEPISSDPKPKLVKHVTINMPKVPPPSPESNPGRPKSRNRRRKTTLNQQQHCRYCDEETRETRVRFPSITSKLPPLTEHPAPKVDNDKEMGHTVTDLGNAGGGFGVSQPIHDSAKRDEAEEKLERRARLIDKLVNAHGEMKRRHNCPQKEVVIAPFKVTIEEDAKSEAKASFLNKREEARKLSKMTKPFTFSYMPSKHPAHHKKKLSPKSRFEPKSSPPEIFNHPSWSHHQKPSNGKKSSIISSFVSANQAKEIYEALVNESHPPANNHPPLSLNKATDCDGLNDNFAQVKKKVKGRDLVRERILSQNSSISEQAKLVAV